MYDALCLSLNSFTRASSGVIVAHLTPTEYFLIASALSIVTSHKSSARVMPLMGLGMQTLVVCLVSVWQAEVVVLQIDIEVRVDELRFESAAVNIGKVRHSRSYFIFDVLPDDSGHLIAV